MATRRLCRHGFFHTRRAGVVTSLALVLGCHPWRVEPPLPKDPPRLQTLALQSADTGEQGLVQAMRTCHADLRSVSMEAVSKTASHARWEFYVGLAALAVSSGARWSNWLGASRNDAEARRVQLGALGVAYSTLAIAWLDFTVSPSLRAARARSAAATDTWIDLLREVNRWESAARDVRSDLLAAGSDTSVRTGTLLAHPTTFEWQDALLRSKAERCGGLRQSSPRGGRSQPDDSVARREVRR